MGGAAARNPQRRGCQPQRQPQQHQQHQQQQQGRKQPLAGFLIPSPSPLWHQVLPQRTPRLPPRSRKIKRRAVPLPALLAASSSLSLLLSPRSSASSITGAGRSEFQL